MHKTFILINNVEDIVVFIFESVISDKILYFSRSRNAQVSFIEKPQLEIFKIIQNYEKGSEG